MKYFYRSLLAACLITVAWGCKKEELVLTQAQLTANQLQDVISKNNIRRVYPVKYGEVLPTPFPVGQGTDFKFSNGFLTVDYGFPGNYNLDYVVGYMVGNVVMNDGPAAVALILYME